MGDGSEAIAGLEVVPASSSCSTAIDSSAIYHINR